MRSKPASRARARSRAARSRDRACGRARRARAATIDCTPKLRRFTPAAPVRGELRGVDTVGIALDGDLGVVGAVDRVEDAHELVGRRAATAFRRRRTRSSRPDSPRRGARSRSATHASTYASIRWLAVGPGREVAVVAARRAERDVHVDAERHASSSRCTPLRLRRPARPASAATPPRRPRLRP